MESTRGTLRRILVYQEKYENVKRRFTTKSLSFVPLRFGRAVSLSRSSYTGIKHGRFFYSRATRLIGGGYLDPEWSGVWLNRLFYM